MGIRHSVSGTPVMLQLAYGFVHLFTVPVPPHLDQA